jgi:putative ABC transport system permease protein
MRRVSTKRQVLPTTCDFRCSRGSISLEGDIGGIIEMKQIFRVASYRFRATFARQWGSYVSLILLVALVGGLSMASLAGARRTDSSFPTYVASTNPETTQVFVAFDDPQLGATSGYDPKVLRAISHLPGVEQSAVSVGFDGNINLDGVKGLHPHSMAGETPPTVIGGSEYLTIDKATLTSGHWFDSNRPDEAVVNAQAALEMGVHVGSVIQVPFYSDQESTSSTYNGPPYRTPKITIVGEVVINSTVIEDEINALGSSVVLMSPALTKQLENCCAYYTGMAVRLRGGNSDVARFRAAVAKIDPISKLGIGGGGNVADALAKGQREIKPEAIALGVFGLIAGIAVLLIAGLTIGRTLRSSAADMRILQSLGATTSTALGAELIGVSLAVATGALLAVALAILLSPLAPLGPVRFVYPYKGVSFDWTVLGIGVAALVVTLVAIALVLSRRELRRIRLGNRVGPRVENSWVTRATTMAGVPLSLATGLRFALKSGRGANAAPVRSAILGAVLAVVVLVTTVTFGASLNNLVSHPSLYGWNWNYALLSGFAGQEDMPAPQLATSFDHDHYVAAWSGANFFTGQLDGQSVQMMIEAPRSHVAPPVLSGHGLDAANQVVLGSDTLTALHKRVGDTVTFSNGKTTPETLTIVGTATLTPITKGLEMGTGALVATSDFPPALLNAQESSIPGPQAVLIRFQSGVNTKAALRSIHQIVYRLNRIPGDSPSVGGLVAHLRPAEIVNYRAMGTTPDILGGGLALGAVVALALTLVASVRRRRRELALLKTLGFVRRQLAAAVAWQSSVAVLIGVVIGVPIGIVLGRTLWILFAHEIDAVPVPSVPGLAIVLIALGALVLANVVATIPGRMAAGTATALVLREE